MEANTVRLKEHEQPVLVLEKSPRASTLGSIRWVFMRSISLCLVCSGRKATAYSPAFRRYTVISGTPEKILEHFLESMRIDIHPSEPGT